MSHDALIKRIDDWQSKLDGFDYFDSVEAERLIADCRAALSQRVRYVPMTNDELVRIYRKHGEGSMHGLRGLQSEFIRRAGLEVQE